MWILNTFWKSLQEPCELILLFNYLCKLQLALYTALSLQLCARDHYVK